MNYQNEYMDLKEYYKKKRSVYNCMVLSALILVCSLIYFNLNWDNLTLLRTQDFNSSIILMVCGMYIIGIVSWIKMKNRLVSLYIIFYGYMFFSNLGQSITHLLVDEKFALFSVYENNSIEVINKSILFQLVCVAGINLGAAIGTYLYTKKYGVKDTMFSDNVLPDRYRRSQYDLIFDIVFYICAAYCIIMAAYSVVARQSMSYATLYETREGTSAYLNFACRILGIYYVSKNTLNRNKFQEMLFYVIWILLIVLYMVAGTRSTSIVYIGILVFVTRTYHPELFKKRYAPIYIVGILAFSVAMSVISVVRTEAVGQISIGSVFKQGIFYNLQRSVYEYGISEYPSLITIKELGRSMEYQQTILYYLVKGFIPSQILNIFGFYKPEIGDPAVWATQKSILTGSETGYSCIAEAYLNYGTYGWLFMVVYGIFISYAELLSIRKIKDGELVFPCIFVGILSKQIFFARGSFSLIGTSIRFSFYIWVAYIILTYRKRMRGRERRYRV